MNKCPRCKLPQDGVYKCQYCGYNLAQDKRRHIKLSRKKVNGIIGEFKKRVDSFKEKKKQGALY